MFATTKRLSRRRAAMLAAVPAFVLCTAGAGAYVEFADQPTLTPAPEVAEAPADLEQAFWACDYVGTTYGMQAAPIAVCSEVTASLQEQKFAGDFAGLLEWWRQNKPIQHARLEAAQVGDASRRQGGNRRPRLGRSI
jgi:hypothetical protein